MYLDSFSPRKVLLPLSIILLALSLRLSGLTWGIPNDVTQFSPFFSDEGWMMEGIMALNPDLGDYNPDSGHREGTLSYFVIWLLCLVLHSVNLLNTLPHQVPLFGSEYALIVYIGRLVIALSDTLSVLLLFLIVLKLTKNRTSAAVAAFALAIMPFEVIYAHFLRGHIMANFFLLLGIFWLVRYDGSKRNTDCVLCGLSFGFAAATRYPSAIGFLVPALYLVRDSFSFQDGIRSSLKKFLLRPAGYLILGSALIGFMIGCPYLFFDYESVREHVEFQASVSASNEFSLNGLFNLSRVKVFLLHLIPQGLWPTLWIPAYVSFLFLFFRQRHHRIFLPLAAFMLLFLYLMAKGYYVAPVFVRAVVPLFPCFALCMGLAFDEVVFHTSLWKRLKVVLIGVMILFSLPSLFYCMAISKSMATQSLDPRYQAAEFIREQEQKFHRPLKLAVGGPTAYFSIAALDKIIPFEKVHSFSEMSAIDWAWAGSIDYLFVVAHDPYDEEHLETQFRKKRIARTFRLQKVFRNTPELLGVKFRNPKLPHDMAYPFPRIYVYRSMGVGRRMG